MSLKKNKAFEQLICPTTTILWKRISQIFWIYFMPFVTEKKNEVFDEKLWNPTNLCYSIRKNECNNISYSYFHGQSCDLGFDCGCGCGRISDYGCGHGHKTNFKEIFYHYN